MPRLPSLFLSHGAPSFALEPGLAGPRFGALGVSPHGTTPTPWVRLSPQPETIHDFGGFAPEMYPISCPALGAAAAARRALAVLGAAGPAGPGRRAPRPRPWRLGADAAPVPGRRHAGIPGLAAVTPGRRFGLGHGVARRVAECIVRRLDGPDLR